MNHNTGVTLADEGTCLLFLYLEVKQDKFYGAIYDIDLDNIEKDISKLDKRDAAYVKSLDHDFEMARALVDSIECEKCDRETKQFDSEEELWEHVKGIRGLL